MAHFYPKITQEMYISLDIRSSFMLLYNSNLKSSLKKCFKYCIRRYFDKKLLSYLHTRNTNKCYVLRKENCCQISSISDNYISLSLLFVFPHFFSIIQ